MLFQDTDIMRINGRLLLFSLLTLGCVSTSLQAAEVQIQPFEALSSWSEVESSWSVRVAESLRYGNASASTHILLDGLEVVDGGIMASTYRAVNAANGQVLERGMLHLQAPDGALPQDGASSAIVGIIPRSASWEAFGPQAPANPTLGPASGDAVLANATLSLAVFEGSMGLSGDAAVTTVSPDKALVESLTLTGTGKTVQFERGLLRRMGPDYHGLFEVVAAGGYDDRFVRMRLTGVADADGDGLPDLTDLPEAGFMPPAEEVAMTWLGILDSYRDGWASSRALDADPVHVTNFPWVAHSPSAPNLDWVYFVGRVGNGWWGYRPGQANSGYTYIHD